jgi:hypothetical protein
MQKSNSRPEIEKGGISRLFYRPESNYFEAAGAEAEAAGAAASAFLALAFLTFLAFGADASVEAAGADAEAGASAANAVAANRPAIKAAINFFIFSPLAMLGKSAIHSNQAK